MTYRDLRYLRLRVHDLDQARRFAGEIFGLQPADQGEDFAMFRSDARNYSLCLTSGQLDDAVALSVARTEDLDEIEARLLSAGHEPQRLTDAQATARQSKSGLAVRAPNGVTVDVVWRPLTSGWRYHGPRDAGIVDFAAVQLCCTDIAANESFWTEGLGLRVSDWAGNTVYLALDDAHHRVALYPSDRDGILGAMWEVDEKDSLMRNWYFLEKSQLPIIAGPDRQAASNGFFVTTRGPAGALFSYVTEFDRGPHIATRGPRQFAGTAQSHGIWGAPTEQPEFLGRDSL
ncbi:MAG: oxidoreductase [Paracoccus denitrificans]|uniref:Oxidoreductase n=1 Tax=Paracoccus denitrificans TaxID=266 RepID=A0A533I691_PARDE|nr:MAG: oxidoreductase [Paracoccus denitrificans]